MKVNVASHAGFCFGVRRATDAVEKKLLEPDGSKIYTLGKLIHNDGYNKTLRERGVGEIGKDDIPGIIEKAKSGEKITVVIRAHGELHENVKILRALNEELDNFDLIDGTCPYVTKVRRIAYENSGEGKFFILIGAAEHPEVQGIMSCLRGEGVALSGADEFEKWVSEGENLKKNGEFADLRSCSNHSKYERVEKNFKKNKKSIYKSIYF